MTAPEKIEDGGPAFPVSWEKDGEMVAEPGMTLRDWFAGQALIGLLAKGTPIFIPNLHEKGGKYIQDTAWQLADTMLKARKGGST